jgi:hypothetical protein
METLNLTRISGPFAGSGEVPVSDDRIVAMFVVVDEDMDVAEERVVVWRVPTVGFAAARLVGHTVDWNRLEWSEVDTHPVLTVRRTENVPAALTYLMENDLFIPMPDGCEEL